MSTRQSRARVIFDAAALQIAGAFPALRRARLAIELLSSGSIELFKRLDRAAAGFERRPCSSGGRVQAAAVTPEGGGAADVDARSRSRSTSAWAGCCGTKPPKRFTWLRQECPCARKVEPARRCNSLPQLIS